MKRSILSILLLVAVSSWISAQNVQVHYDFGGALYDKELDGRSALTTTVEMFRPDKWGNTFFFVDMDYKDSGVVAGYWEIAREFTLRKGPFSVHAEYNGGLATGFSYNNAYLGGITYAYNNSGFTKGFTITPMYKYIQKHGTPHNFQLTATWYWHFGANQICTFAGFADWWREKTDCGDFIFLAEPQFWVNLNKIKGVDESFTLSIGSEVELANNFGGRDGFYCIPTFAVKWTFR